MWSRHDGLYTEFIPLGNLVALLIVWMKLSELSMQRYWLTCSSLWSNRSMFMSPANMTFLLCSNGFDKISWRSLIKFSSVSVWGRYTPTIKWSSEGLSFRKILATQVSIVVFQTESESIFFKSYRDCGAWLKSHSLMFYGVWNVGEFSYFLIEKSYNHAQRSRKEKTTF